jgi:hypothetical protein
MKKIIVGLLVPFAIAAAGCDRTPDNDQVSRLDPPPTAPAAPVTPAPVDPTASSSTTTTTTTQETTPAVESPTSTETPASQSKY